MLPALIAGAAGIAGSLFSSGSSARQAREQMKFQERMSSTAHQREVADLRAAGLNPLLSVNAGASSPAGAMGQPPDLASVGVDAVNTAFAARRLKGELEVMRSQSAANRASAASTLAGIPTKQFVGGVASDAKSLYRAAQEEIRRLTTPSSMRPRGGFLGPRKRASISSAKQAQRSELPRPRYKAEDYPADSLPFDLSPRRRR